MTSQELIRQEIHKIIDSVKDSFKDVKSIAVAEAWKILQLLVATVIRVIEKFGDDLAGSEKKKIAMNLIGEFYDTVFNVIDLPFIPSAIETMLHSYVKKILMLLVDSAIDALVATFRDVGVFATKTINQDEAIAQTIVEVEDFLKNLDNIVRVK